MARRRALLLGWDGADPLVLRQLAELRRIPNLAAWMREAPLQALPSTTPPMSFPAWSSFLTGLEPGEHGIFDFTQKLPGAYRIRFVNAADRAGASLFALASRAGRRVLALGVPASFPPEPVDGLLVPGFDSPVSTGSDPRASSDPALYRSVAERAGPWMTPELDEGAREPGWHERAVDVLLGRIDRKTGFALEALRQLREAGREPDLMVVVFSESDTVAHHFWRDWDRDSPRRDPHASQRRRGALGEVYQRLDAASVALRDAFGADAACAVLSDHGQGGASARVVHPNRHLADAGLLCARRFARADRAAREARDAALRALPPRAAEAVFRRVRGSAARVESAARFGAIRWERTAAFSEEVNTQPGVWINLRGREARGCVAPEDYERVREDVVAALLDWRGPGGGVVARARRREEVYRGPHLQRAPDVVVELALENGYAHSVVPTPWNSAAAPSVRTLDPAELAGGRGRGMNGTHRPDGVWLGLDPELREAPAGGIAGVAPRVLAWLGVPWERDDAASRPDPYGDEDERRVAARLRALGYLD